MPPDRFWDALARDMILPTTDRLSGDGSCWHLSVKGNDQTLSIDKARKERNGRPWPTSGQLHINFRNVGVRQLNYRDWNLTAHAFSKRNVILVLSMQGRNTGWQHIPLAREEVTAPPPREYAHG